MVGACRRCAIRRPGRGRGWRRRSAVQEGQRGGRGMTVTYVVGRARHRADRPGRRGSRCRRRRRGRRGRAGSPRGGRGWSRGHRPRVRPEPGPGGPVAACLVVGVGHDLGHQRVERGADRAPRLDGRVGTQPRTLRPAHVADRTRRRPVVLAWPLGAEPGLDGVAGHGDLLLGQRQRLPGGHRELQPHQVEAGDQLGHAVLHLQPGVHLQEEELVPSTRNSTVPTPWYPTACAAAMAACHMRAGSPATRRPAPPRSPSGGAAARSTPGRTGAAPSRGVSPMTWTST